MIMFVFFLKVPRYRNSPTWWWWWWWWGGGLCSARLQFVATIKKQNVSRLMYILQQQESANILFVTLSTTFLWKEYWKRSQVAQPPTSPTTICM